MGVFILTKAGITWITPSPGHRETEAVPKRPALLRYREEGFGPAHLVALVLWGVTTVAPMPPPCPYWCSSFLSAELHQERCLHCHAAPAAEHHHRLLAAGVRLWLHLHCHAQPAQPVQLCLGECCCPGACAGPMGGFVLFCSHRPVSAAALTLLTQQLLLSKGT